ncbi:MAG TPA: class I SAM-dependent methyltransferase [Phycicoccus sp.]|nr:class I SAM-dependent methyltransferase [Phycicoccus sp.]
MGARRWWEDRALPRLVDVVLTDATAGGWRRAVTAGLSGDVVELGFGSGRNLPHYPAAVHRVLAVEPADLAWERARERVGAFGRTVERVGLDGADLPLEDASVDAVVTTWTLCTIPDLGAALAEARRVLRPGGTMRFVEHALAPGGLTRSAQRRLQPLWGPVAGGCHLDRDLPSLLDAAGFAVELDHAGFVVPGPMRPWGWFVLGTAHPDPAG